MKRSEAIQAIGRVLVFGREGLPNDKQEKYVNMSLADVILTELEEIGMAPPEIKEWIEVLPHNILGAGFKIGHNVHKWEPE